MSKANEEIDYVERACALAPEIEARADQIEQERRLPEPVLAAHCPLSEPEGSPRPTPHATLVEPAMLSPAASATFVDVWHVSGLKGTGSDAYAVDDLFVPHDHSISRDDPAERRQPGLIYCFPTGSFYASGFASVALGIARRMLDAFVSLAREKTPRGYKRPLANNAVIQSQVGQAEAQLSSAR